MFCSWVWFSSITQQMKINFIWLIKTLFKINYLPTVLLDPGKPMVNKKCAQHTLKNLWIILPLHNSGGRNYMQPKHICVSWTNHSNSIRVAMYLPVPCDSIPSVSFLLSCQHSCGQAVIICLCLTPFPLQKMSLGSAFCISQMNPLI